MKCSACQINKCERKFEFNDKCLGKKEGIECSCVCQVTSAEEMRSSAISISFGITSAVGGIVLTSMTGGLFSVIGGAALFGAGSSMIMNPIQRRFSGDCNSLSESATDIALGASIGAISGPIGIGGSALARGASSAIKLGIRTGVGALAGGISGTVSEAARAFKGEEVNVKSFAKAAGIGAIAGSVGGASTHIGTNLSKGMTDVSQAITRISVQASAAAATDASLQFIEKGDVDTRQLLLNTAGQITVAATSEITQNYSKSNNHINKSNNELRQDREQINFLSPKDIEAIMNKVHDSNKSLRNEENLKKQSRLRKKIDHPETHGVSRRRREKLKIDFLNSPVYCSYFKSRINLTE